MVVLPDPQDRWLAPSEHRLRAFDAEASDVRARDLTDVNAVDDQLRPPTDVLEPRDQARGRVSRRTERGVLSDPDGLPLRRLIDDVASSNAIRDAVEVRSQIGGQGTDDQVLRAAIVDESAVGPHGVSDDRHLGVGPWEPSDPDWMSRSRIAASPTTTTAATAAARPRVTATRTRRDRCAVRRRATGSGAGGCVSAPKSSSPRRMTSSRFTAVPLRLDVDVEVGIAFGCDQALEHAQRVVCMRLDAPLADPEGGGDLDLRHVLVVAEHHDRPLARREQLEQPPHLLGLGDPLLVTGRRLVGPVVDGSFARGPPARPADRLVGHDSARISARVVDP